VRAICTSWPLQKKLEPASALIDKLITFKSPSKEEIKLEKGEVYVSKLLETPKRAKAVTIRISNSKDVSEAKKIVEALLFTLINSKYGIH
jgi:hypothetical protein